MSASGFKWQVFISLLFRMDSSARFSCLSYLDSLMHLQSAGSQWPRSPVQAIGWGRRVIRRVSLVIQGLFWACSHGSELQSGQEQQRGSWQALDLHSITSTSLCGQSKSLGQPRSMEQRKKLCLDGRSLQSIVAAFAIPCFLILSFNSDFLCYPQGSQDPVSGMVLQ